MCRIAGIVSPNNVPLLGNIIAMRDAMERGGPDGYGHILDSEAGVAFGHRRLALLDLSPLGKQPMCNFDESLTIVFNGEIYNFLEIKTELIALGHSYVSKTDTEVILLAYQQWGMDCFEKFNGMFALAIFDKKSKKIILSRDRSGIKPLYYYQKDSELFFSSEARAFQQIDKSWKESEQWKALLLAYGHIPEPYTTLADVLAFPKGHYGIFCLMDFSFVLKSFVRKKEQQGIRDVNAVIAAVKHKLTLSVERHLICDAPIGIFLSGGIDSSILTLVAAQLPNVKIKSLSIVFEEQGFSEEPYQKMVAEKAGIEHRSFLVTRKMFKEELPMIMEAMDQPSIDGINSYFISKFAREYGLTAVLSGLGADELFGGYASFKRNGWAKTVSLFPSFILNLLSHFSDDKFKRIVYLNDGPVHGKYLFLRGLFTPSDIANILQIGVSKVERIISDIRFPYQFVGNSPRDISHLETHLYMQNQLLRDTDVMSMWHGIEVRVPFLDNELVELVNSIPDDILYNSRKSPKYLLIEAFVDILPIAVWNRQKKGFSFPLNKWLKDIVPMQRNAAFEWMNNKFNEQKIHWSKYWAFLMSKYVDRDFVLLDSEAGKVCFYNLDSFASMGGIEKFNRAMLLALNKLNREGFILSDAASMYDSTYENRYVPSGVYRMYGKSKFKFLLKEIQSISRYDVLIIGHINLSLLGLIAKLLNPNAKLILVAHGIEVWAKLSGVKKIFLQVCDNVWSVSQYTKTKLKEVNQVKESKVSIFHNTIDPFFSLPKTFLKPMHLYERHNINASDFVLFSLTRLSTYEKYKGYDNIIEIIPYLLNHIPNLVYFLAGKSDEAERLRIEALIEKTGVKNNVKLLGYINEVEVTAHYQLADIFILPSKKEGFGIVFIEAMVCGLPVIAGNKDGSVDALLNGQVGKLVNPDDKNEIIEAVIELYKKNAADRDSVRLELQHKIVNQFGFDNYCQKLKQQLENVRA